MGRSRSAPVRSWLLGVPLLVIVPSPAVAQAAPPRVSPASTVLTWSPPSLHQLSTSVAHAHMPPARARPSATRTIAVHTAAGAVTGLLIGYLGSSFAPSDEGAVVLTWTAIGTGAGVASGVLTWLFDL